MDGQEFSYNYWSDVCLLKASAMPLMNNVDFTSTQRHDLDYMEAVRSCCLRSDFDSIMDLDACYANSLLNSSVDEELYLYASRSQRSEEHTSELQSLMRISYAVFCLKQKKPTQYT